MFNGAKVTLMVKDVECSVKFYRDTLSSLPENQNHNLIKRELVYECRTKPASIAAR